MVKPITITLLGRRWRLRRVRGSKDFGACDPPEAPRKEIRVRASLRGMAELDTLLHELLHACNWTLDEDHVDRSASDIAKTLWRLGYRKTGDA